MGSQGNSEIPAAAAQVQDRRIFSDEGKNLFLQSRHIPIQVELLRVMGRQLLPEFQFLPVIEFSSRFPFLVPPLFFLPRVIEIDLF